MTLILISTAVKVGWHLIREKSETIAAAEIFSDLLLARQTACYQQQSHIFLQKIPHLKQMMAARYIYVTSYPIQDT